MSGVELAIEPPGREANSSSLTPACPASPQRSMRVPTTARPLDVLVWAACAALTAGLVEGAYWALKKYTLGKMIFLHPSVVWLAPLVLLTLLAAPALLLAWRLRVTRDERTYLCAVGALSFPAWLSVALLVPYVHFAALLVLSLGLSVATTRIAGKQVVSFRRNARRGFAALALLVAAVALGQATFHQLLMLRDDAFAGTTAGLRDADAAQSRPNILLLVLDTVRADALTAALDGDDASGLPNIAELARRGVVFDGAIGTAPWTLPAHGGMFTGRPPQELSGDWLAPLDRRWPTLAEALRDAGYSTGGFVANTRYCSAETGLARGFEHYDDYRISTGDFLLCTALGRRWIASDIPAALGWWDWPGRKRADELNAAFLDWQARQYDRPFFAFLNYWDAHDPYCAPPPFDEHQPECAADRVALHNWWWLPKEQLTGAQAALGEAIYGDSIRYLDAEIGRLLHELSRRGTLDNTIVILTSDHGEHFGDHGLYSHGNSLYQALIHLPLVIAGPGVPKGKRVEPFVSLADLPATVIDTAGIGSAAGVFPGQSLARAWDDAPTSGPTFARPVMAHIATQAQFPPCHGHSPVARGPLTAWFVGCHKYIAGPQGEEELYDLSTDPREEKNLLGSDDLADLVGKFRRLRDRMAP